MFQDGGKEPFVPVLIKVLFSKKKVGAGRIRGNRNDVGVAH